ncbi:hypothetical protein M153_6230001201 [Pseudoloma neurophilia]|uniref:Inositol polyphosphate-related phosphatase domain-containing protein n=1 Tax=Pseudoloma neurophilia TaxID=146866 RepID=A0A0R0M5N4_9MICR|nr:hypothetical protein M153_6230001201 [Pseudoloma neurophilia]
MINLKICTWNVNNNGRNVEKLIQIVLEKNPQNDRDHLSIKSGMKNNHADIHQNENSTIFFWILCFQEVPLSYKLMENLFDGYNFSFTQNCSLLTVFFYKKALELSYFSCYMTMAPSFVWKGSVIHFLEIIEQTEINKKTKKIQKKAITYSFALLNIHLAAHKQNNDKRISQLKKLDELTNFFCQFFSCTYDKMFLVGDFNTRATQNEISEESILIEQSIINYLAYNSQKDEQMMLIKSMFDLSEPSIDFDPTYKILQPKNPKNKYLSIFKFLLQKIWLICCLFRKSKQKIEKHLIQKETCVYSAKQLPSWCDRILFKELTNSQSGEKSEAKHTIQKEIKIKSEYGSLKIQGSDHLPVYYGFSIQKSDLKGLDSNSDQISKLRLSVLFRIYCNILHKKPKLFFTVLFSYFLAISTRIFFKLIFVLVIPLTICFILIKLLL